MEKRGFFSRHSTVLVQVIIWLVLITMPVWAFWTSGNGNVLETLFWWLVPVSGWMLIFYLNYLLYIPRVLFRHKLWKFIMFNFFSSLGIIGVIELIDALHAGTSWKFEPVMIIGIIAVMITYIFVIFTAISIRSLQRNKHLEQERETARLEQSEMELSRLKSQLNPHFLFNSLNNISALSAIDAEAAQQAIETLSSMLRYVLYDTAVPLVPLESELQFMRDYITLMSLRYTDSLSVKLEVDPELPPSTLTPPMLFISLVENAFKYGASSTHHSEINISVKTDGDMLTMRITNTLLIPGVSAPAEKSRPEKHGVGLRNLHRRLEILFPGNHTLTYGPQSNGLIYEALISIPK
ncbi:MAG: histidine kinase [Bacteroidales bacterium]|nr:histidine kinase [Bacteroidales bacterium]